MLCALGRRYPGDGRGGGQEETRDPGSEDSSGGRLGPGVWGPCIHSQSHAPQRWCGAAAPPHTARLPAPSGEGAPEKAGEDAEADCRGTVVGRVYSGVCEVTLLSTQFQHIPGSCRTPTVPHYTCTWASPPEASGSSNGGLLTNLVIFALTSQITADSFLGESTSGAELEPAALGSGHSNFIFNCGRVPSLGESSWQQ